MRVYLDNCCFNRPFDDQTSIRIPLEAEAKLYIQEKIHAGQIELVWSYILDYENVAKPFEERRQSIAPWRQSAVADAEETPDILRGARILSKVEMRSKDALHVACAIAGKCDYFLTTDDRLLTSGENASELRILDPTAFVREVKL